MNEELHGVACLRNKVIYLFDFLYSSIFTFLSAQILNYFQFNWLINIALDSVDTEPMRDRFSERCEYQ